MIERASVQPHAVRRHPPRRFRGDGEEMPAKPAPGEQPSSVYAMFVAPLHASEAGEITGIGESRQISPALSANTCGWFHPTKKARVVYGSTMTPPGDQEK